MPSPSDFVMPAQAGIQLIVDINNFKDLDSRSLLKTCRDRFRGNDGAFPITTQSRCEEEDWGEGELKIPGLCDLCG